MGTIAEKENALESGLKEKIVCVKSESDEKKERRSWFCTHSQNEHSTCISLNKHQHS